MVGAVLDGMGGQHPERVHTQGPALRIGCLSEAIRGHEHSRHPPALEVDDVVHTARRARSSVGQGFDHRAALGGDLAA